MDIIKEKPLSKIREEKNEKIEIQMADLYEILINLDDRLSNIENKLWGTKVQNNETMENKSIWSINKRGKIGFRSSGR